MHDSFYYNSEQTQAKDAEPLVLHSLGLCGLFGSVLKKV